MYVLGRRLTRGGGTGRDPTGDIWDSNGVQELK